MSMNVFVLCDSRWHPGQVVRDGTAAIADRGFRFEYSDGTPPGALDALSACPVAILSKSNTRTESDHEQWIEEGKAAALSAYVEGGGGLVVVHSGTAGYRESTTMRGLLGGLFLRHPEQCTVAFEVTASHPVTEGVGAFEVLDEHYWIDALDPSAEVLAKTSAGGVDQPGCWVARRGEGRVCVITPGHNLEVWLDPDFRHLLRNALLWCAQADPQPLGDRARTGDRTP